MPVNLKTKTIHSIPLTKCCNTNSGLPKDITYELHNYQGIKNVS